MATGKTNNYRMMIHQDDGDFMRDQLSLSIIQKVDGGYRRVKLVAEVEEEVIEPHVYVADGFTPSKIPMELAELLLNGLARYVLSSEGDVVATIHRLTNERNRVITQLENLIAGIGRMGGKQDG